MELGGEGADADDFGFFAIVVDGGSSFIEVAGVNAGDHVLGGGFQPESECQGEGGGDTEEDDFNGVVQEFRLDAKLGEGDGEEEDEDEGGDDFGNRRGVVETHGIEGAENGGGEDVSDNHSHDHDDAGHEDFWQEGQDGGDHGGDLYEIT